jgi:rubrerythrin
MNGKCVVSMMLMAVLMGGVGAAGVLADETKKDASVAATVYTCPMHPEVISDKPGKCPKCGMNLVPVSAPVTKKTKKVIKKTNKYVCVACDGEISDKPGECHKCGAPYEEEKSTSSFQVKKAGNTTVKELYTCPNCTDETSEKPGACPKCGVPLIRFNPSDTKK